MAFLSRMVGKELCDILGLDGNKVRKITLTFESQSIVMADAAIIVETEEYDKITPILKRYKMVPINEEVPDYDLVQVDGTTTAKLKSSVCKPDKDA